MKYKRIKKYACLKIKRKHFKDRQEAYLLSDNKCKLILDNLNYSLAKLERDNMDKMGEQFVKFMLKKGEEDEQ